MSNNEHRILNGEAEIGGVVRGGWFNRFLGCARNDNGCARNDKDWGWESGFGGWLMKKRFFVALRMTKRLDSCLRRND